MTFCFYLVITVVFTTWPTDVLFPGAGDTWESTTGLSYLLVLCSVFTRSTQMRMGSTQALNLPFKYKKSLYIVLVW